MPLEDDGDFQKISLMPYVLLGGRSYFTLYLGPLNFRMYVELNGLKAICSSYMMWDVVNYDNFCYGLY